MPSTVMPVFPVWVGDGVSTDVGAVGEEESPPPQPVTAPSSPNTTITTGMRLSSASLASAVRQTVPSNERNGHADDDYGRVHHVM